MLVKVIYLRTKHLWDRGDICVQHWVAVTSGYCIYVWARELITYRLCLVFSRHWHSCIKAHCAAASFQTQNAPIEADDISTVCACNEALAVYLQSVSSQSYEKVSGLKHDLWKRSIDLSWMLFTLLYSLYLYDNSYFLPFHNIDKIAKLSLFLRIVVW